MRLWIKWMVISQVVGLNRSLVLLIKWPSRGDIKGSFRAICDWVISNYVFAKDFEDIFLFSLCEQPVYT